MNGFKWKNDKFGFNQKFIKSYNEDSHKCFVLKSDGEYLKHLHDSHSGTILTERNKN